MFDLPAMFSLLKQQCPDARMVLAGTGPAEAKLKATLPGAEFLGWVGKDRLPEVYSGCDALVLPSRFDTFGCVVIEAMSCGLPVVAYDCKGPRDIVEQGRSGFLVESPEEMADQVAQIGRDAALRERLRRGALQRARAYAPEPILQHLLRDLKLEFASPAETPAIPRSPASDAHVLVTSR